MSTEAQRLISVSLTKIAHSRAQRGGVSLHKNLLVATVLQRARYIFMEEAYHMVHAPPPQPPHDEYDEETLLALTAEEAGIVDVQPSGEGNASYCDRCGGAGEEDNKENQLPPPYVPTYIDLDKDDSVLRERVNTVTTTTTTCPTATKCLKRRRETEDAVASILPKRKCCDAGDESDECEVRDDGDAVEGAMEIDRITSLVSIFTFGGLGGEVGKLARSVSTPDLCSAQAKDSSDALQQQRASFLTMTV